MVIEPRVGWGRCWKGIDSRNIQKIQSDGIADGLGVNVGENGVKDAS